MFFLPDGARRQIADVTAAALKQASRSWSEDPRGRTETARSCRAQRGRWAGRGCYLKPLMRAPMASPIRVGRTAFIAIIA